MRSLLRSAMELSCQKEKAVLIKSLLPHCSAAEMCQAQTLNSCQELLVHYNVVFCKSFYWQYYKRLRVCTYGAVLPLWFHTVSQFSDLCSLCLLCVLFQDEAWLPWVGGVFPARRWAGVTARAGCGEREMQRVTFLRNGRSTGLFLRTIACTGTSTRR